MWIRAFDGSLVPFHALAEDADLGAPHLAAHLIFAPDDAIDHEADVVRSAYLTAGADRDCPVPAHSVALAPGSTRGRRDAAFTTHALSFDAEIRGGAPLPRLDEAEVRVPAIEALLGPGKSVRVGLFDGYVKGDFDAAAGIFAELRTPLPLSFSADQAGGLTTPNVAIKGIGRKAGAVAADLKDAVRGAMRPADVFASVDARLLGAVSLKSLLPDPGPGLSADHAPRLATQIEGAGATRKVITTLEWAPPSISPPPDSILRARPEVHLTVNGRIEQPLPEPGFASPAGLAPVTTMHGDLTGFELHVLNAIVVGFRRLAFTAGSGGATTVDADLASDPVGFEGDLSFIGTLADVIPDGIFGTDGPSIDVAPDGVHVGYALPLPNLPVGVFSLENMAISAGLSLPFLSGRPQLDVGFAERDHPFIVTVMGFGGGGFVHVRLDAEAIRVVEGQLEFGGHYALDIGVASGGVELMAGIYFKLQDSHSLLAGFVDLYGEVRVLGLVSVSVEFNLTLSYHDGKAMGRATLTVAVHVFGLSKSVSLSVERSFGSGDGDPPIGELVTPNDWTAYARAFA
jgi:hypothetical protein